MAKYIGVDLGTANTLVYVKGKGIVLKEPSVVAVHAESGAVLAVGTAAKKMMGRTPETVRVIRPLTDGVIADFDVAGVMLKSFIEQACPGGLLRPYVAVCVPNGVTEVERRAVLEAVIRSGGKNAYLIEEPMAAALGAGLPVFEAVGSMIVDIGGGTCEVAVLSYGGIVAGTSIRYAGDRMDEDICEYLKDAYNLAIGRRTAEAIKISIGSAYSACEEKSMQIMGMDLETGLPKLRTLTSEEVSAAMAPTVEKMIGAVRRTLEKTPPELAADIVEGGIVLTGGGAQIPGLTQLVEEKTGIRARVSDNPEDCVAVGAGMALTPKQAPTAKAFRRRYGA